ncbi:hypothetical protein ACWDRR_23430 [Kitasatospora sp. NPDC003701]
MTWEDHSMGYLRKTSFLIFHDPGAPDRKVLDAAEIAKVEAAHEAGKQGRIDALIRGKLVVHDLGGMGVVSVLDGDDTQIPGDSPAAQDTGVVYSSSYNQESAVPGLPAGLANLGSNAGVVADYTGAVRPGEREDVAATDAKVAGSEGDRLRTIVRQVQDDSVVDENAFKDYLRKTFPTTAEKHLRDFAWDVYKIVVSKAELPGDTYTPHRAPERTVRSKDGARFGVNEVASPLVWSDDKGGYVNRNQGEIAHAQSQTLWVKVADGGWEEDGDWGGYLQITSGGDLKGRWIDSSDGWVASQGSKVDGTTFYDMGTHYEIWQGTRQKGRPLVVEKDCLRFVAGATPGRFQIEDATWR